MILRQNGEPWDVLEGKKLDEEMQKVGADINDFVKITYLGTVYMPDGKFFSSFAG